MDYLATIDSPVGSVTVASDGEAIVGLWLEGQKHFEATLEAAEDRPEIPYGQLTTYGWIARRIEEQTGTRTSARAVGSAVGRNPISIILPCHRVVGSTGSLTGYAGGLTKKIALLGIEGIDVDALSMPTKGVAL